MNASRGMTFIEVGVWVSVFTITVLAIMMSVLYFYRTNTYTVEQGSAVASSQRGVDKMVRVIREAAYGANGAYPIVSIGPHELRFYADTDADEFIEQVRYTVSGTTLAEGVVEPSGDPPVYGSNESISTLSDNVRNIDQGVTTFTYYDESGALIGDYADIGEVRFVKVNLVVNVDPNRLPNQFTLRSSAALRNLK